MKIFRNLDEVIIDRPGAVTVGTFDGVHLGHQQVLKKLNRYAQSCECLEILVTFHPHPQTVVKPKHGKQIRILTTLKEKLRLLEQYRLPAVLVIPFNREFARIGYRDFVRDILVKRLRVKKMVVGHDHAFGRNREGHIDRLQELGKEFGFSVNVVPPYYQDGEVVSSTRIRQALIEGNVERANRMLGRYYSLGGEVEEGTRRGRALGFPTANIRVNHPLKLSPKKGVYAVDVLIGENRYKGMMNIGHRPSFNFDPLTLEVHIINFFNSIYGKNIEVEFKKYIREERKFASPEELQEQLENDREICKNI